MGYPLKKTDTFLMVFRAYFSPSPLSLFSDFLLFLFSFYRYRPPASTLYSSILSLIIVSLIFFPLLHLNQLLSNSALVIIYLSFFIAFNYLYSSLHLCPLIFVSQFPHPSIANITAMMITVWTIYLVYPVSKILDPRPSYNEMRFFSLID